MKKPPTSMFRQHRLFLLLLLLLFPALLLTACSRSAASSSAQETDKLIRVGFSQVGAESDWRMANTASMLSALSEENGFELIFDNAKQHQENQLLAIRNFIQQRVDYIVLAPIAESGWESVLQEAKTASIPVIVVDRQISVEDGDLYTCWVGSDFLAEGERIVGWLEETLQSQGRTQETVRILHIRGTDGASAQIGRTKALNDAVASHPSWSIAGVLPGEYTEAKSYELVRDFLKQDRDIQVIYSENDNMSFGAMRALDEAGISYGDGGDVMILSFDAVREAMRLCLEGKINACAECNPLHGPRVASLIRQMEAGETPEKLNYVKETLYTRDMLNEQLLQEREY